MFVDEADREQVVKLNIEFALSDQLSQVCVHVCLYVDRLLLLLLVLLLL